MLKDNVIAINNIKEFNIESKQYVNKRLTSIVILTYNKLEYTQMCIESIRNFTANNKYEIIVVDNNSQDDTVEWLKQQSDLRVIYNSENLGFPKGCNQGIEIADGDNILLLNNDVIVTENWLKNLDRALWSDDNIGAVGAVSNNCSYYQQINTTYNTIDEMFEFAEKYNKSDENMWKYRTKLIGFCMLIKRSVIDKVGLLDERFTPGNFEDDDLSFRILNEGYKLLLCKDTFIHHFGSVSFREKNDEYTKLMQVNSKKFEKKWKFNPSYSNMIRFDLINNINSEYNRELNILEVGCGAGATLLEIKNRYKNANVYGIEICEGPAKIASNIANIIVGNIETIELPYEKLFFDYIILGDVLEHLNDPWNTLSYIKNYLKKDGYIIASLPNIMHVSVVRELSMGNFSYADSGILDRTHLRFFTLKEIYKLFDNNYNINKITSVVIPTSDDEEQFINKMCELYGSELEKQYKSYQYIVKANKKIDYSKYETLEMIELKYNLMRIDNQLEIEKNLKSIVSLYDKYRDELIDAIEYFLDIGVINKDNVLNKIGVEAFNCKLYEFSISILMLALKINRNNIDVVYNLCFLLKSVGEYRVALNILSNSSDTIKSDNEIESIKMEIEKIIYG